MRPSSRNEVVSWAWWRSIYKSNIRTTPPDMAGARLKSDKTVQISEVVLNACSLSTRSLGNVVRFTLYSPRG